MPDILPEGGRATASGDAVRSSDVEGARERTCCAGENDGSVPGANELLHQVAGGTATAYAELYRLLAPHVYCLCLRVVHDPHMAEDAAQEALLDLWRHAPRFDPARAHAHTWAMTITHHRAVDLVRTVRAEAVREQRVGSASWTPPHDVVPEAVLRTSERQDLRQALSALTERQRHVIDLLYYRGHTMAETAALLGKSVGTVKFTAHAARHRIRETLNDHE